MGGPGSGAKPKVYPAELVAEVRQQYDAGRTQEEIAAAVGLTQKVVWRLMLRHRIDARAAAKRDQRGPANHMWSGDAAGYQALHLRVETARGKPAKCGRCGADDPAARYEWANLTGRYTDVEDYERMCVSCHHTFDARRRAATGQRTSPVRRSA